MIEHFFPTLLVLFHLMEVQVSLLFNIHQVCYCPEVFLPSVDRVITIHGRMFSPGSRCCFLRPLIVGGLNIHQSVNEKNCVISRCPSFCNLMRPLTHTHTLPLQLFMEPTHCSGRGLRGLERCVSLAPCLEALSVMGSSSCKTTTERC